MSNIFSSQFKCLSRKKIGITAPHYMKKSLTQSPLFLGTKKVCVKKINLRRFLDFSTYKKFNLHLRVKIRYEEFFQNAARDKVLRHKCVLGLKVLNGLLKPLGGCVTCSATFGLYIGPNIQNGLLKLFRGFVTCLDSFGQ